MRLIDPLYADIVLRTIALAGIATVACLVLAFPLALFIARAGRQESLSATGDAAVLDELPGTNLCLDVPAARYRTDQHALLQSAVIASRCRCSITTARCCSAWSTGYLPFVVLPLYATLERLDNILARSRCGPRRAPLGALTRVVIPLCAPGVPRRRRAGLHSLPRRLLDTRSARRRQDGHGRQPDSEPVHDCSRLAVRLGRVAGADGVIMLVLLIVGCVVARRGPAVKRLLAFYAAAALRCFSICRCWCWRSSASTRRDSLSGKVSRCDGTRRRCAMPNSRKRRGTASSSPSPPPWSRRSSARCAPTACGSADRHCYRQRFIFAGNAGDRDGVSLLAFFQWMFRYLHLRLGMHTVDPGAYHVLGRLCRHRGHGALAHASTRRSKKRPSTSAQLNGRHSGGSRCRNLCRVHRRGAARVHHLVRRYVITSLVAGVDSETLPMVIYAMARRGANPVVNAISTADRRRLGVLIVVSREAAEPHDAPDPLPAGSRRCRRMPREPAAPERLQLVELRRPGDHS